MYLISLFLFSFHLSLSQPHLPLSQVFSKDEILVYTPDRNYTAHQFSDLLTDAKYGHHIIIEREYHILNNTLFADGDEALSGCLTVCTLHRQSTNLFNSIIPQIPSRVGYSEDPGRYGQVRGSRCRCLLYPWL